MELDVMYDQKWVNKMVCFTVVFFVFMNITVGQSTLSGQVQSWDAEQLSNCSVWLQSEGDTVNTNSQGQFTITGLPTGFGSQKSIRQVPLHFSGENLRFHLLAPMVVSLEMFEASGAFVYGKNLGMLGAGEQVVHLSKPDRYSNGNYFLKIKMGEAEEIFKVLFQDPDISLTTIFKSKELPALLKKGRPQDTLTIQCPGFSAKKIEITDYQVNLGMIEVRPPNVIIIYLDDSGYDDYSIYGQQNFETPNLDRMANEGILFTNYYSAASGCSQSRAALITGTYPARYRFPYVVGPTMTQGLPENEKTIAEILKEKKYVTAHFGKWHLGNKPEAWPLNHGFDEFLGIPRSADYNGVSLLRGVDVVSQYGAHPVKTNIGKNGSFRNGIALYNDTNTQEHLTEWFTNESIQFISRNKNQPFFLYLAYNQPHVGLFVHDDFKGISGAGLFGDVMVELDTRIGQVMHALKLNQIDNETLVFFASDNGPWLEFGNHAGTVGPFRPGYAKRTAFEAGVRMPGIMRFPGHIKPNLIIDTPVMAIDILPTISAMVNGNLPDHKIDGTNISPLLLDPNGEIEDRLLYIYEGNELQSIRHQNYKFYFNHIVDKLNVAGMDGASGSYSRITQPEALFDLSVDLAEENNILNLHSTEVDYIKSVAEGFNDSLQNLGIEGRPIQHY